MKKLSFKEIVIDVSNEETVRNKIDALKSAYEEMLEQIVSEETDRFFVRVRTSIPHFENF